MEYQRFGSKIVARIDKGEEIVDELLHLAVKENIKTASVSGIGAVDRLEVGVFDLENKKYNKFSYEGNHEINSIAGDFSRKDGRPYLHLHTTCTDKEGKVVGGHLFKGVVSLVAEIIIDEVEGADVGRVFSPDLGINILKF
ncbi:MAG: DNA-binding protein [Clostridia bacterium]|nr:DNA-binding protein [Clostridia bacterium]